VSGPAAEAEAVVVSAPAKLTVSLRVTGARPDGYHLLRSEMVSVDMADTLSIAQSSGASSAGAVALTLAPDPDAPGVAWDPRSISLGGDNLVARALVAVGRSASVHVVKRVPPGAGLGGGSADAAAILRWAGCTDLAVAASLGADVPFCLTGGRALVEGVGEKLTPLTYEDRRFTLLLVPFGVDTAAVYRAWDRLAAGGADPVSGPDGSGGSGGPANDLEDPALVVEPRLGLWRDEFHRLTGRRPQLAGSGSTWFIEGSAEDLGLRNGQLLQVGGETGVLVSVRTAPPVV
jgi:4-diphosphocytidyl-2-C-methyl-D-erythritol kinase